MGIAAAAVSGASQTQAASKTFKLIAHDVCGAECSVRTPQRPEMRAPMDEFKGEKMDMDCGGGSEK